MKINLLNRVILVISVLLGETNLSISDSTGETLNPVPNTQFSDCPKFKEAADEN